MVRLYFSSFVALISCAVIPVHADFDHYFYEKFTAGRNIHVMPGEGPIAFNSFEPVNTKFLVAGEKENLKKYFDFPENMSAVVLSNGKLVYERYNESLYNVDFLAHGHSMSKTAVGLVVGHLLCDGRISSLDDPLGKFSQGLANSVYKDVTVRNLLRMASGVNGPAKIAYKNSQKIQKSLRHPRFGSPDPLQVIQNITTRYSDQGEVARYHGLDTIVASFLVNEITGQSVDSVFFEKIYSQIGAEGKMTWWADKNGNSLGWEGLKMTTRDWARLGQYMVNEMRSSSCIGKFLKEGLDTAIKAKNKLGEKYGYFFWVSKVRGKPVIFLIGAGGQVMIPNHYNDSVAVVMSASNWKYKKKKLIQGIMSDVTKKFGGMHR